MKSAKTKVAGVSARWKCVRLLIGAAVGLSFVQAVPSAAQSSAIEFTVSGTSTIRGWTCTVQGAAEVRSGAGAPAPGFDAGVQTATLSVPVNGFDCPEEEMREHLLEAMRADEFANITFRLEGYEVAGRQARATGSLTILDATEPVTFPVSLSPSGGDVTIAGELRLDMTTYGVEPPVVMLGLLRVRPQITIQFDGLVSP